MKKLIALLSFSLILVNGLFSQEDELIRLSGLVMELDSIKPVPYATITIQHQGKGTVSNNLGIFSVEVHKGDTIVFSSVGFRTSIFIIGDSLDQSSYSIIQRMPRDTVILKTLNVDNWPSIEAFNNYFTEEYGYDDELVSAIKNSNPPADKIDYSQGINPGNYTQVYGTRLSSVYENANIPLNNLLNPKRWDKLLKDWKQGKHR